MEFDDLFGKIVGAWLIITIVGIVLSIAVVATIIAVALKVVF